jgi:predicted Rossmann fold flavoprotein
MMTKRRVIVAGAGPAGLMAAGQAAASGVETLLLEGMGQPGRKLRITGKGRCNITNTAPITDFMTHFGRSGKFLRSAFSRFFNEELMEFFSQIGLETVTERGGRVFPECEDAQQVVDALVRWAKANGVVLQTGQRVEKLIVDDEGVRGVEVSGSKSQNLRADAVILAMGGASYPGTGSTGDGFRLAKSVGHTIVPIRPALVPLVTAGDMARRAQGLSLRNVRVSVWVDGSPKAEAFGEMLFTHFGLSGPIILSLSKHVVDARLAGSQVSISIDLKPALDEQKLDARLLRDLDAHGRRQMSTLLQGLLPSKLIPLCCDLTQIPGDKLGHQITAQDRDRLRQWLKDFRFQVTGDRGFEQAVITAGGVTTREIDPRTMASRKAEGLYLAGEMIDVDADTGGFNLQAAFSTGWIAGRAAAQ